MTDAALDLRPAELMIVVPLVACLLALSVWPAAITDHITSAARRRHAPLHVDHQMIQTPHIDWFALSPELTLLGAAALCLFAAVLVPRAADAASPAVLCARRLHRRVRRGRAPVREDAAAPDVIADALRRDRWGALAQLIVAGAGLLAVLISYSERMPDDHVAEYYALLAACGGGHVPVRPGEQPDDVFLGLEWFSICLYVLCAIDVELEGSLEAGLKYLIIGSFGSAFLLFGSALVYGATGQISFEKIARRSTRRGSRTTRCSCSGSRCCSRAWCSRPRRRRSTCGRRTSTRARRRR